MMEVPKGLLNLPRCFSSLFSSIAISTERLVNSSIRQILWALTQWMPMRQWLISCRTSGIRTILSLEVETAFPSTTIRSTSLRRFPWTQANNIGWGYTRSCLSILHLSLLCL